MAGIKSLVKDTAVYGLSSIVGRFLNWCLVPLYTYLFVASEYGVVSFLYSFTAVALVILNYGMETGFFRFANKHDEPETVYTTSLVAVGSTSCLFIALLMEFLTPVSGWLHVSAHPEYVAMLGITVAIDAFTNLPFAYLRYKKRPFRFAGIKLMNVGLNIGLNLFFLLCCPWLMSRCPGAISWFYEPLGGAGFGIGWIFLANLISTICILLMLLPELTGRRYRLDTSLLRDMLSYSWPLLILGIAGVLSQNMGQMVMPYLFPDNKQAADTMVGIYSANMKIAIVMVMFTQAFRYAYEPFIFSQASQSVEGKKQAYCDAMKYFVIFGLFIFLGVMYFLPVLRHFIAPGYWEGLRIVPVLMAAELCFGVFFNLSLWYKLTDRTRWGMYLSLICFVVMLVCNIWLVRWIGIPGGYMGSAWAALIAYFAVMVISYFLGRKYYPLDYPVGRMGLFLILAAVLWGAGAWLSTIFVAGVAYAIKILLLAIYAGAVVIERKKG